MFSVDFSPGAKEPGRPELVLEPALGEEPALAIEGVGLSGLAEPRHREDSREIARDRHVEGQHGVDLRFSSPHGRGDEHHG